MQFVPVMQNCFFDLNTIHKSAIYPYTYIKSKRIIINGEPPIAHQVRLAGPHTSRTNRQDGCTASLPEFHADKTIRNYHLEPGLHCPAHVTPNYSAPIAKRLCRRVRFRSPA
jgi:hypothetical protein